MAENSLTLYHHGTSVCAAKVRLVLAETGIAWDGVYIDIMRGEQFEADYLKLNPNAVVPTLVHDGRVIVESTVICHYLDQLFAERSLVPSDPYNRAQMMLWCKLVDEKLHPMTSTLTYACSHRHTILDNNSPEQVEKIINETVDPVKRQRKRGWIEDGTKAPDVQDSIKTFASVLQRMSVALEDSPWLAGPDYSLADIALTPYVNRLSMLGMEAFWQDYPSIANWFERVRSRDNFHPGIVEWFPDGLRQSLAQNGARSWPEVARILAAA